MEIAALPLPGTQVTHPVLLLVSAVVLAATMFFWVATGRRKGGETRRGDATRRRSGGPSVAVNPVTVNVDPARCERFGHCEREAPHVFQVRREGRLTYQDRVPADEIEPVIRAVEVCPARAISLDPLPNG